MPAVYWCATWDRWGLYAFCGRYGHQPISELRRLTDLELRLLARRLLRLVENERPEIPSTGREDD